MTTLAAGSVPLTFLCTGQQNVSMFSNGGDIAVISVSEVNGQSGSLTLGPSPFVYTTKQHPNGSIVTVNCTVGSIDATQQGAAGTPMSFTGAQLTTMNAAIAAGTASYAVGTQVTNTDTGAVWSLSGVGTSAAFAASGGGSSAGVLTAKSTVSCAGDSIFQRGWDTGLQCSTFPPLWASSAMTEHLDIMNCYAVGGTTSLDLINSQLASIVADGYDIAWIHTGANNFSSTATTARTIAQSLADMRTILDALVAVKKAVIWDAVNPAVYVTGSRWAEAELLNDGYAMICAEYASKGVIWNDCYNTLLNTASLTGDPVLAYLTDANIHPNTWGAKLLGRQSAKNISKALKVLPGFNVTGSATAMFQVGTGTSGVQTPSSGVVYAGTAPPTSMTVAQVGAGTLTGTQYTTTAGQKRYRLECPSIAANGTITIGSNNDAALAASFSNGDIVRPYWEFALVYQTGMYRGQTVMSFNGTARSRALGFSPTDTPTQTWPSEMWAGKFYGSPYTLGAAPTAFVANLILFFGASGGSFAIEIVGFGIEKVVRI